MKYVSIDIETTGLDPETCDILEVAAVIDNDPSVPATKLPTFRYRFVQELYRGRPIALVMHWDLFMDLASHAKNAKNVDLIGPPQNFYGPPSKFALSLNRWLYDHRIDPLAFVVAGKNFANFDARFLSKLPRISAYVKWHHRILDPGNMFVLPGDLVVPDTNECCLRAGINLDTQGLRHTAIYDAQQVVSLVRAGFERTKTK